MSINQDTTAPTQESIFENDYYKETQADILAHETKKTMQTLFIMAALLFTSDLIALSMAHQLTAVTTAYALVFPAIFAGLAFLSRSHPKFSMLCASILMAIIIILTVFIAGVQSILSGFLMKGVIVYLLIRGWNHAKEASEARANLAAIS